MQGGAPLFHGSAQRACAREHWKRSDNAADGAAGFLRWLLEESGDAEA